MGDLNQMDNGTTNFSSPPGSFSNMFSFLQQKISTFTESDENNNLSSFFNRFVSIIELSSSSSSPSIKISSDGKVLDAKTALLPSPSGSSSWLELDKEGNSMPISPLPPSPSPSSSPSYDTLHVAASPTFDAHAANGFSLSSLHPKLASQMLTSTTAALSSFHHFVKFSKIKTRSNKELESAAQTHTISLTDSASPISTTPLLQPPTTLHAALQQLTSYEITNSANNSLALKNLEDHLLPTLHSSVRACERRTKLRESALEKAFKAVDSLDKKLLKVKNEVLQKESLILNAEGERAKQANFAFSHIGVHIGFGFFCMF